jgi:ferredoxin-fold anticodon binding domain-containing protein
MCKENVICEEHPQRSPSSVKYSLSPASREISLKLQNLDCFSAAERRKWKSNTYNPDISLL